MTHTQIATFKGRVTEYLHDGNTIEAELIQRAYNDATKYDAIAGSMTEAAELLGVEESELFTRCVVCLDDLYIIMPGHEHRRAVKVWEVYSDPGSDDYIYILELA